MQLRLRRWAAVTAPVLAVATVVPVATALEPADPPTVSATRPDQASRAVRLPERVTSRTATRDVVRELPPPRPVEVEGMSEIAVAHASDTLPVRWTEAELAARVDPAAGSRRVAVIDAGTKVRFTGTVDGTWAEVVRGDRLVWVRRDQLARSRPTATEVAVAQDVSGSTCPDGSSVESGLTANTVKVYRAVCAAFPSITSWGGRSGSGDHGSGRALDIMVSGSLGTTIAGYVRAHAGELGVSYVIFAQRIWTLERSGEGWRAMSDRGSSTANHYDHVHVSVF